MYKIDKTDNVEATFNSLEYKHYYVIRNGELMFEREHESIGRDYYRYKNCGKRYLDRHNEDHNLYVNGHKIRNRGYVALYDNCYSVTFNGECIFYNYIHDMLFKSNISWVPFDYSFRLAHCYKKILDTHTFVELSREEADDIHDSQTIYNKGITAFQTNIKLPTFTFSSKTSTRIQQSGNYILIYKPVDIMYTITASEYYTAIEIGGDEYGTILRLVPVSTGRFTKAALH